LLWILSLSFIAFTITFSALAMVIGSRRRFIHLVYGYENSRRMSTLEKRVEERSAKASQH